METGRGGEGRPEASETRVWVLSGAEWAGVEEKEIV